MRILIVEDEKKLNDILQRSLKGEGYTVDGVTTAGDGFESVKNFHYDLIILDLQLPDGNGTNLLKRIREQGHTMPALVLTARSDLDAKLENFRAGADDYVVKPVAMAELAIRVQALLRRGPALQENIIRADSLEINRLTRQVKRDGKRIELSAKEYSLLEYLLLNSGRILSRSMIVEKIWDQSFEGLTNIVDVYIGHLRRKIDEGHDTKLIRTVRGLGYTLELAAQNMKLFRSVTARLIFFYCLLLALLGGAFMLYTVLSFRHYARDTVSSPIPVRIQVIWDMTQGSVDDPARLGTLMERFATEAQDRFLRIRHGAQILYRSGDPADHSFSSARIPLLAPAAPHLLGDLIVSTRSFIAPNGKEITIDAGQSLASVESLGNRLAALVFIGLTVLLLLTGVAGFILMQGALKPVEAMIKAAEAYSFSDPQKRLPLIDTDPKLEALGLALNRMLDRLDAAYVHVSRFSADAAHELRTPLTIIRGELELVMGEAKASPDLERAISNALEEMNRLSGMVDSLITLSRMESLWGRHTQPRIALLPLAQETMEQMNLLAEEKNIVLKGPDGDPAVAVTGDRDRLKQVLVNLIDNAIKYTPQGGEVRVSVTASGSKAQLKVQDTGIGVDPAHQVRIFDRFYRVSTDRGEAGAGLGLAIVRSICHAHGGTVTINSIAGKGSAFVVELPLTGTEADVTRK